MDAVTYPDGKVGEFIPNNLIPLRVSSDARPLSHDFNVVWTPALLILDEGGIVHHRTTGFFSPEELIPSLQLGIGKLLFGKERFDEASSRFDKLLRDYASSHSAPEAVYYRGVNRYKLTQEAGPLKEAYRELQSDYPESEWTLRAEPYRLL
jgi:tetratricopeptide (TPR) repeat protein